MKKKGKKLLIMGIWIILVFIIWTWLLQCIDVQPAGQRETEIKLSDLMKNFRS